MALSRIQDVYQVQLEAHRKYAPIPTEHNINLK